MDAFKILDQVASSYDAVDISSDSEEEEQCPHTEVFHDASTVICKKCYQEIHTETVSGTCDFKSDSNRCKFQKKHVKSIEDDIVMLNLPRDVVERADELYKEVSKTVGKRKNMDAEGNYKPHIFRKNTRKSIIVACVALALDEQNTPIDLTKMGKRMNLQHRQINSGYSTVTLALGKKKYQRKYFTPIDKIPDILSGYRMRKGRLDEMRFIYKKVAPLSLLIKTSKIDSVAVAVVYYYSLTVKDVDLKLADFATKTNVSPATIIRIVRDIDRIMKTSLLDTK
jgi:hypothetical protein